MEEIRKKFIGSSSRLRMLICIHEISLKVDPKD